MADSCICNRQRRNRCIDVKSVNVEGLTCSNILDYRVCLDVIRCANILLQNRSFKASSTSIVIYQGKVSIIIFDLLSSVLKTHYAVVI